MTEYCKETVYVPGIRGISHRCYSKAKRDGYCETHHPDAVKRRQEKSAAKYAKMVTEDKAWAEGQAFNRRAGDRCRELGIEPEEIKA